MKPFIRPFALLTLVMGVYSCDDLFKDNEDPYDVESSNYIRVSNTIVEYTDVQPGNLINIESSIRYTGSTDEITAVGIVMDKNNVYVHNDNTLQERSEFIEDIRTNPQNFWYFKGAYTPGDSKLSLELKNLSPGRTYNIRPFVQIDGLNSEPQEMVFGDPIEYTVPDPYNKTKVCEFDSPIMRVFGASDNIYVVRATLEIPINTIFIDCYDINNEEWSTLVLPGGINDKLSRMPYFQVFKGILYFVTVNINPEKPLVDIIKLWKIDNATGQIQNVYTWTDIDNTFYFLYTLKIITENNQDIVSNCFNLKNRDDYYGQLNYNLSTNSVIDIQPQWHPENHEFYLFYNSSSTYSEYGYYNYNDEQIMIYNFDDYVIVPYDNSCVFPTSINYTGENVSKLIECNYDIGYGIFETYVAGPKVFIPRWFCLPASTSLEETFQKDIVEVTEIMPSPSALRNQRWERGLLILDLDSNSILDEFILLNDYCSSSSTFWNNDNDKLYFVSTGQEKFYAFSIDYTL